MLEPDREPSDESRDAVPPTEARNPRTVDIDRWENAAVIDALLDEDERAITAARDAVPALAELVDAALERIRRGGRIHYFGAGASGRLALMDASETTPTYGVAPDLFRAHFPGGAPAVADSSIDLEDAEQQGWDEAGECRADDVVIGVTASGTTPYVRGALRRAGETGSRTALLTCDPGSPLRELADTVLVADTGAEAITGSTRLKAGTATKVLLNAFSTTLMVRAGRTYSNLMVEMTATNSKLEARGVRLLQLATDASEAECAAALAACDGQLPVALTHLLSGAAPDECRSAFGEGGGVRAALARIAG